MYTTKGRNKCAAQVRVLTKVLLVQYIGQIQLDNQWPSMWSYRHHMEQRTSFFLWKEGNLWWNQRENLLQDMFQVQTRELKVQTPWHTSGISVQVAWVGQVTMTCSGTCTPKWRYVSNHVEAIWGRKVLEEVSLGTKPKTVYLNTRQVEVHT